MVDAPTDAFKGIPSKNDSTLLDRLVKGTLSGMSCWDARHFLHIAEFGYQWESNLAFFPLFPALLRILGQLLQQLVGSAMSLFSAMLVAGIALNNVLFVLNGLLLLRLALLLNGGNQKEAIVTVYMHCWCPASIFYSALYSESVYVMFTQLGLIFLCSASASRLNQLIASLIFAFAFLTRSNGLANIGFVGFQLLLDTILCPSPPDGQPEFRECSWNLVRRLCRNAIFFLFCFFLMALPVRVFEFAVRDKFCAMSCPAPSVDDAWHWADDRIGRHLHNATAMGLVLPGELAKLPWCNESISPFSTSLLLPAFYAYVQQKYWEVGLFAYWQLRKLPLFLIAGPTLCVALYGVFRHTIGLLATDLRPVPDILCDRRSLVPFALHTLFLALSGLFFYNVEVSIRLLFSTSPFLYIVLAKIICAQTPHIQEPEELMHSPLLPFLTVYAREGLLNMVLLVYLLGFFIFGTMAHSGEKILISVVSMLAEPNDESAANVNAAKMWRDDRAQFDRIAHNLVRGTLGFPTRKCNEGTDGTADAAAAGTSSSG
uniref:GPI mannosyltransferase 2 n=1 Tax=Globodera pallida TaxID=36090 RepID=A0A183CAU5_GLOPA